MSRKDSEPKGSANQEVKKEEKIDERYILQSTNTLGAMIITKPLYGNNYNLWSRAMLITLRAREKLDFINGKCTAPTDIESKEYEQWKKAYCMVYSWLLSSISKEMSDNFLYTSSAYELWKALGTVMDTVMVYCLIFKKKFTI